MLDEVLQIVGIKKVYWVDDRFDARRDISEPELYDLLGMASGMNAEPKHAMLSHLSGETDASIWTSEATKIFRASREERDAVVYELRAITQQAPAQRADYDATQLEELRAVLKDPICLGYDEWRKRREEIRSEFGPGTLLLLDRQFEIEGISHDLGETELVEIIGYQTGVVVVVLTHSVDARNAEGLRQDLARKHKLNPADFAVMAKQADSPGVASLLTHSVRIVLTHRACYELINGVSKVLAESMGQASAALLGHSVFDLDRVIFKYSADEGSSEFDIVVRLLSLRARVLSEKRLFDELPTHIGHIEKVRRLHDRGSLSDAKDRSASELLEWQRDEIYDRDERVNAVMLPLGCGDILQGQPNGKLYVLLAQQCDLAVRKNGKRNLKEAWFIQLRDYTDKSRPPRWHDVPSYSGTGKRSSLDFLSSCTVSLDYVDYVVFNRDGAMRLDLSAPPDALLLEGWRKRLTSAQERLRKRVPTQAPGQGNARSQVVPVKEDFPLALSDLLGSKRFGALDAGGLAFPFRRVGRLRQPYAQAAWAAFAAYQLRPAFPREFVQVDEEPELDGDGQ